MPLSYQDFCNLARKNWDATTTSTGPATSSTSSSVNLKLNIVEPAKMVILILPLIENNLLQQHEPAQDLTSHMVSTCLLVPKNWRNSYWDWSRVNQYRLLNSHLCDSNQSLNKNLMCKGSIVCIEHTQLVMTIIARIRPPDRSFFVGKRGQTVGSQKW